MTLMRPRLARGTWGGDGGGGGGGEEGDGGRKGVKEMRLTGEVS